MPEYLRFRVSDAGMLKRAIEAIEKVIPEACFVASEEGVMLRQLNPTHVALAQLTISDRDLLELQPGERFCLNIEKLATVLGRIRPEDEDVELSVVDDKVRIVFPRTKREYVISKIELEEAEIPLPEKLEFTAEATIPTKELRSTVKDMEAMHCDILSLEAQADKLLATCESIEGERYARSFEPRELPFYKVKEPSKALYDIDMLDTLITTAFDTARLRWAKDMPVSVTYDLSPHSSLEFVLAPRIEG
jgi:proliferating cell nuclear antigen